MLLFGLAISFVVIVNLLPDLTRSIEAHQSFELEDENRRNTSSADRVHFPHRNELSFELHRREIMCFTEEFFIPQVNFTFEYSVLRGGTVQVWATDPASKYIYTRQEGLRHQHTFSVTFGHYSFCFANHNYLGLDNMRIYLRLEPTPPKKPDIVWKRSEFEDEDELSPPETVIEAISEEVLRRLADIRKEQRNYRLDTERGRHFGKKILTRVGFLAPLTTVGLFLVGMGQTLVLRRIFTPSKSKPLIEITA